VVDAFFSRRPTRISRQPPAYFTARICLLSRIEINGNPFRHAEAATYLPPRCSRSFSDRENTTDLNHWIFHHSVPRCDRVMKLTWADSLHRHVPDWFKIITKFDICAILIFINIVDISRANIVSEMTYPWLIRFTDYDEMTNNKFEAHWIQKVHIDSDRWTLNVSYFRGWRKESTDLFYVCPKWNLSIRLCDPYGNTQENGELRDWIKQIFDLIKFVIRVTARADDGNLRTGKAQGSHLFVDRNSICVRAATEGQDIIRMAYNTRIITFLQIYEYVHACYLSIEYIFYFPFKIFS